MKVKVNCANCDKELEVWPSEIYKNGLKFCNKACSGEFHRGKTFITLKCPTCLKDFEKLKSKYDFAVKNGRDPKRFFCSSECSSECFKTKFKDKYSPFRYFLNNSKRFQTNTKNLRGSKKAKEIKALNFDLDLAFLKELWEKQNSRCAISNLKMILPKESRGFINSKSLKNASLDRIDSEKGYTQDNVQFICLGINYMKNDLSNEEVIKFIKDLKK